MVFQANLPNQKEGIPINISAGSREARVVRDLYPHPDHAEEYL